ncbi:MAG: hypothetical protein LCH39_08805 [Proteobacteria bacterium]|nr:hypothetical protein [Pseudomonadota bacterium]
MQLPSETLASEPPTTRPRERLWLTLAALGLFGAAAGFWFANGTRTFGEAMLGAFAWCF